MQIVYLRIEEGWEYDFLANQDFNFSSEHHFRSEKKDQTITLDYQKNNNYIKNFFGEKVVALTAIVGENGVGKTSLFSYLNDRNINHDLGWGNSNYILIVKIPDNDKLQIINKSRLSLEVNSVNKSDQLFVSDV